MCSACLFSGLRQFSSDCIRFVLRLYAAVPFAFVLVYGMRERGTGHRSYVLHLPTSVGSSSAVKSAGLNVTPEVRKHLCLAVARVIAAQVDG